MTDIKNFLGSVIKFGGANLLLVLLLAWFFQTNFSVSPVTIATYIEYLYIAAFYDTIVIMIFARLLWMAEKTRTFIRGEDSSKDIASKTPSQIAQELGFDTVALMAQKASDLKIKLTNDPEKKIKKVLEKELKKIEKELAKLGV